jgi:hypothetical protein
MYAKQKLHLVRELYGREGGASFVEFGQEACLEATLRGPSRSAMAIAVVAARAMT